MTRALDATPATAYAPCPSPLARAVRGRHPRGDGARSRSAGAAPAFLFPPGELFATSGARDALAGAGTNPLQYLARHVTGDWGDVTTADRAANDHAVRFGGRILSEYRLAKGVRLWVLTEADRSSTTLLLPSEY